MNWTALLLQSFETLISGTTAIFLHSSLSGLSFKPEIILITNLPQKRSCSKVKCGVRNSVGDKDFHYFARPVYE